MKAEFPNSATDPRMIMLSPKDNSHQIRSKKLPKIGREVSCIHAMATTILV